MVIRKMILQKMIDNTNLFEDLNGSLEQFEESLDKLNKGDKKRKGVKKRMYRSIDFPKRVQSGLEV